MGHEANLAMEDSYHVRRLVGYTEIHFERYLLQYLARHVVPYLGMLFGPIYDAASLWVTILSIYKRGWSQHQAVNTRMIYGGVDCPCLPLLTFAWMGSKNQTQYLGKEDHICDTGVTVPWVKIDRPTAMVILSGLF